MIDQVVEIIKQFGPAIVALLIAYYRDQVNEAKSKERMAELEAKLLKNREDVKSEDANLSDDDVINKYTGTKP